MEKTFFMIRIFLAIDAALGCELMVPTLHGEEKIKVDSGSQPNTIIKLKEKEFLILIPEEQEINMCE